MRRIIVLNRYFFPDHSATSQILGDLAFHLASAGRDVRVITGTQRYDDPRADLPAREVVAGVAVRRLTTTRFGRAATAGRAVDYAAFYAAVWRAVLEEAEPGDILVAMTDPPLLCVPALAAARRRRVHLVNWLQDLYPEVAMRLGVRLVGGPAGNAMLRARDRALHAAVANIVVGEGMARTVRERGVARERVHVIPNWCDDTDIQPRAADSELRREWELEGRFVVGYSGNLGRGHEYETVLGAARRLRDDGRIIFLMIGGGSGFDALSRKVQAEGLAGRFRFLPYQDRAQLRLSLAVPDVHWLSLLPELEGLMVPSKFYGIAAAGRPVIAIVEGHGEIARLVREHDCGMVITPGDGAALADTLRRLAVNPDAVAAMGAHARAMLGAHFTRRDALERWERLLDTIG